jgi:hypothetical protein
MSSISLGGVGQSLYTYMQGLNSTQQPSPSTSTAAASSTPDSDGDSASSTGSTRSASGHHHGGGEFFKSVQSAVSTALQTAQSSGTSTNPNQLIQSAIEQVLQSQQNGSSGTTISSSGNAPDGSAAGVSEGENSTSQSAFAQLLQSNGVSAQQFQQDFQAAIQSAQNGGSADPSSVFSSFPAGSTLNVVG